MGLPKIFLCICNCRRAISVVAHIFPIAPPLVRLPFIVEIRSVEDVSSDASSVDGWVGVEWSDDDLELGLNSLGLLRVTAQQGDCSYPLSCTCIRSINSCIYKSNIVGGSQYKQVDNQHILWAD